MAVGVEHVVPRRGVSRSGFLMTPAGRAARLGLAGSILVTLGSFGVGDIPRANTWLQDASMAWVTYGHGKSLSALLFWAGVALMVIGWVRLGRAVLADRTPAAYPATASPDGIGSLRWAAAAWAAPLMLAVPVYSRDVYAYLAQGALLRDGLDPYVNGPATRPGALLESMAQVWATTTAPYGPFFVAIARGVTEITGDHVVLGVLAMRLVMLPGWALMLWAVPRLAAHVGQDPRVAMWLVAFNPMVVIHLIAGPHVEMLMAGVLVAGVVLALEGRHIGGLLTLGAAVSIKVTAGVAIPFVAWIWLAHIRARRDVRPGDVVNVFATTMAVTLAVFGAFTLIIGHGFGWLNGLGYADRIINWLTLPTATAHVVTYLVAPVTSIPLGPVLATTRAIGSVALAVCLIWTWWRSRGDERSAVIGIAVAMFAVLLLEPSTLPWYYSWALVFAGAAAITRRWLALVAGTCTFMLVAFQPDDSILLYQPIDLLFAVAVAGLAAWSLLRADPLRIRRLTGRAR